MKVLLSAYACRPNHGSEPAVGWNWAVEIANLGHDVTVVTRKDNKPFIEKENINVSGTVDFVYYDVPKLQFSKKISIYLYYTLWQIGIYLLLKKSKKEYDIVHHITYVSFRFPIFIYKLKGKFIFGPIAGGEESSKNLTASLPLKYRLVELVRTIINSLNRFNIYVNNAYKKTNQIYVTTEESFLKVPAKYHYKTKIFPAIGINSKNDSTSDKHEEFTILYAGQLLHWKGVHIVIESFAKALNTQPNLRLKIIGSGKFKNYLTNQVFKFNILDKVVFVDKLPQNELFDEYKKAHLFLFPSLHDSGGFVVLEAMSYGLPVICLDKGGPPIFVGKDSPNIVKVERKTIDQITNDISFLILDYYQNETLLKNESIRVKERSKQFEWSNIIKNVYS